MTRLTAAAKSTLTPLVIAGVTAASALVGLPAGAAPTPAEIHVGDGVVHSTKGISNIVIKDCDENVTKIEFRDEIHSYTLPAGVEYVWVKSGNNKSGDGPGYGEMHYVGDCDPYDS